MSKLKPNFTQIPNIMFDELLPDLKESELKVLLYIMRRTYGFQKETDKISLSQIRDGIMVGDSNLDYGTGLGQRAIVNAIKLLEERGLILVQKDSTRTNRYTINLDCQLVSKGNKCSKETKTSINLKQKLVSKGNTQKKEIKKESITEASSDNLPPLKKEVTDHLLKWSENRRGFKFVNYGKQMKAFKVAQGAKLVPKELKNRWIELEGEEFWKKNGFDWNNVINSFDKKK